MAIDEVVTVDVLRAGRVEVGQRYEHSQGGVYEVTSLSAEFSIASVKDAATGAPEDFGITIDASGGVACPGAWTLVAPAVLPRVEPPFVVAVGQVWTLGADLPDPRHWRVTRLGTYANTGGPCAYIRMVSEPNNVPECLFCIGPDGGPEAGSGWRIVSAPLRIPADWHRPARPSPAPIERRQNPDGSVSDCVRYRPTPRCGQTWAAPDGIAAVLVDSPAPGRFLARRADALRVEVTAEALRDGWRFLGGPTQPETPREAFERVVRWEAASPPDGVSADDWLGVLLRHTGDWEQGTTTDSVRHLADCLRRQNERGWALWARDRERDPRGGK